MSFHSRLSGFSVVSMVHGARREEARINYLVDSLLHQNLPPDEFILVDTTPEPIDFDFYNSLVDRGVIYLHHPREEINHAWAINNGITRVGTQFTVVTDIDTLFIDPHFFTRVLLRLRENRKRLVLAVCGYLPDVDYTTRKPDEIHALVDQDKLGHMWSPGGIQACETSWLHEVGGYDEKYILDGWDVDMIARAREAELEISWIEFEEAQYYHQWHEISPLKGVGSEQFLQDKSIVRNPNGMGL